MSPSEQYNEIAFYTLAHPDNLNFIHQHIVDAYLAQTADGNTKPISIAFSLVGLYLTVEKNYTGRKVQKAHMQLAKNKKALPIIALPERRGDITISQVLSAQPGMERDEMIKKWCASVWNEYNAIRPAIILYLGEL